jgi:hypothetical protein
MQGAAEETLRPANETLGSRGEEGGIWPHGTCAILSVPNWSQLGGQLLLPNRKPTSVPTPGPNYLSLTPGPNSWSQLSGSQLSGSHLLIPSLGPNSQGPISWSQLSGPNCQGPNSQGPISWSHLSVPTLRVPSLGPNSLVPSLGPNSQGPISWSQLSGPNSGPNSEANLS